LPLISSHVVGLCETFCSLIDVHLSATLPIIPSREQAAQCRASAAPVTPRVIGPILVVCALGRRGHSTLEVPSQKLPSGLICSDRCHFLPSDSDVLG
jgi:hypothetical protein